MQVLFQVEEQEIAVGRVGEARTAAILYWEAAEGGNGIWTRLCLEPMVMGKVAEEALRICHFDPATGEDTPRRIHAAAPVTAAS